MTSYTAYLAAAHFENELEKEMQLKGIDLYLRKDRLFIAKGNHPRLIWSQLTLFNAQFMDISSIGDASKKLKNIMRNWSLYSVSHHRRGQLIQGQLPKQNILPLDFLGPQPQKPMGMWVLLDPHRVFFSSQTSSLYPLGAPSFLEDKVNPPSRAYLKLWEFFTVYAPFIPTQKKIALDVGSCPGGWTWVLDQMNFEKIYSVDKAPLDSKLMSKKNISFLKQSAFSLSPDDFEEIDLFCSDIICYPQRLLNLVERFRLSGKVKNFVCTLKYQSETDWDITNKFLEIPHSKIVHLHHNKHEVTWYLIDQTCSS